MYPNELSVGGDTLDLKVRDLLDGAPLVCFDPGRAYVVEFWAAWKGPYRSSILDLDALRAMHPELPFVAVAVHEPDLERVRAFVRRESEALLCHPGAGDFPAGDRGSRGAPRHDGDDTDVSYAFIVDRAGRIAWIGPPNTIGEPLRRILESGDDRGAAMPAGSSTGEVSVLESAALERLAACDSEGALRLIAEAFTETPGLRVSFFLAKASDLLIASGRASAVSLEQDPVRTVATDNARMLIAAADIFTTAVEIDNAKPLPELADDIPQLAVAMLMKAEALVAGEAAPILPIMISRALARLLLAIDLPEHALERAKTARRLAEQSFGDFVGLRGFDTLVTRCQARLC